MSNDDPTTPVDVMSRWVGIRGRRIIHTGAWSMVAKASAAANLFLTVPFVLHALGPALFGVWVTLVSLVTFAGFLDFGLGNGTMNLIAAAHGRGAHDEVGRILYEGRRTLLWLALWLAVAASIAVPLIPWQRLLGLPEQMAATSRAAVAAIFFAVVLAVPLNLANRVQLGLGHGDRAFKWQALGQLLTLVTVITLAKSGAPLPFLVLAAVATPLLSSVANTWLLWLDPQMATPTQQRYPAIAAHIRKEGLLFFILQLAAALAYSTDLPLISTLKGSTEAGTYAIVQRLFSVIPLALGLVWVPLWPIYRQALAIGDHGWVKRTLRRSVLLAVVAAMSTGFALALGFHHIAELWVHQPLAVGGTLLAGFAVWLTIDALGTAVATFLNAASIMRFQVITASIFAIICFGLKAWAISHLGIWIVPWITAATFLCLNLIPTLLLWPRIIAFTHSKLY
ncbi:lipopolysaccharide biosynthesis protein [Rhodanobacter sp. UC4450_H17]